MLKNKFIELVQNKKELAKKSFEILKDNQTSFLVGGCRRLQSCGVFRGNCDHLVIGNCGQFYAHIFEEL
jgi:hypothetical protein